jgi:ADP-ribose pyrophosphatase YjhB (NUDIX family)
MSDDKRFFVSATAIIKKNDKVLICKRASTEKAFPNKWTVPGGKFQQSDYVGHPVNAAGQWYHPIDRALRREIKEEVNLEVGKLDYVASITFVRPDNAHALILSFAGDHTGGDVKLCPALTEYAWVTREDAKKYDLIDGIYDEICWVFEK